VLFSLDPALLVIANRFLQCTPCMATDKDPAGATSGENGSSHYPMKSMIDLSLVKDFEAGFEEKRLMIVCCRHRVSSFAVCAASR